MIKLHRRPRKPFARYLLHIRERGQVEALEHFRGSERSQVLLSHILIGEGDVSGRHEQQRPRRDDETQGTRVCREKTSRQTRLNGSRHSGFNPQFSKRYDRKKIKDFYIFFYIYIRTKPGDMSYTERHVMTCTTFINTTHGKIIAYIEKKRKERGRGIFPAAG